MPLTRAQIENHDLILQAQRRGLIEFDADTVTYVLRRRQSYRFADPEEWVRAHVIAFLVLQKGYPPARIRTEVTVPRRTPEDLADVVVFSDDFCRVPYLVIECKRSGMTRTEQTQAIEQLFGNANSLRAPLGLFDDYDNPVLFDVANFPAMERTINIIGTVRDRIPELYGQTPTYSLVAGQAGGDIAPVLPAVLVTKIRRAHSLIWSGGKRDPLTAFDEWSKLLFAKVEDERNTPNGHARKFQVGTNETTATVANRVHQLFEQGCRSDPSIFPDSIRIELPDKKVFEVVRTLQNVSLTDTGVDSIGVAFESFFGSVFRGELGQYFTMRQIARFVVGLLDVKRDDYVIDLTAGSGGFLLETLLQVWKRIEQEFAGRAELDRYKADFALHKVYGIEIHEVLARICKINLLLHHDGHTNIEGDRSCLDQVFSQERLNPPAERFTKVVGNPPFGDEIQEGDEDQLGENSLENFLVARGRTKVQSEHVIIERAVNLLEDGGELGLVVPDGVLNNQGEISNCPEVRRYLAKHGHIVAIVSLPDFAFRKSGAQNKTSILFLKRFNGEERAHFASAYAEAVESGRDEDTAIGAGLRALGHRVFLAEANWVGYTSTGAPSERNDLFRNGPASLLETDQSETILGEYRRFLEDPAGYQGLTSPDCAAFEAVDLWEAHESHRLDPKYHLFKREEQTIIPDGWVRVPLSLALQRRENVVHPEREPEQRVTVMTLAQTGEIRRRAEGKGRNPPEWLGMYFENSPSKWCAAEEGDVVFSSIDLWKGCIAVVPPEFDGAIVTKEFPIYEVIDDRLVPEFLSCLLRGRYYQRAFRAITTGHSNRRRTQASDFEALEICFPADPHEQEALIADVMAARENQKAATAALRQAMLGFSDIIDQRGDEEYELGTRTDEDEGDV